MRSHASQQSATFDEPQYRALALIMFAYERNVSPKPFGDINYETDADTVTLAAIELSEPGTNAYFVLSNLVHSIVYVHATTDEHVHAASLFLADAMNSLLKAEMFEFCGTKHSNRLGVAA